MKKYKLKAEKKSSIENVIDMYKLRGTLWFLKYSLLTLLSYVATPVADMYYVNKSNKHLVDRFMIGGIKIPYFIHEYNRTAKNERAIEIPLVTKCLEEYKGKRILEVGNVLSHYFPVTHDIVDNYEIAPGVINEDIMEYKPTKKYDLIVSISTIEHVGVDGVKEAGKAIKAINALKKLLAPGGKLVFTIPINYNSVLDRAIRNEVIKLTGEYYFKKVSSSNKWMEIGKESAYKSIYGFPFQWGNAILLGIYGK